MTMMIQIRNVPDQMHRELKSRAALAGMSLSDYLLQELKDVVDRPTPEALKQRLQMRQPVHVSQGIVAALRDERESR